MISCIYDQSPFVSPSLANLELIDHNDLRRSPPSYERDPIRRLTLALSNAERRAWAAHLTIMAFLDLDIVYFRGVHLGNVRVAWSNLEDLSIGNSSCPGRTSDKGIRRAQIGIFWIHLSAIPSQ